MKKKKKYTADIILIASLLVAGGIIAAVLLSGSRNGSKVIVRIDDRIIQELSLESDTEYVIENENGRNVLVIHDGQAWISEADCRDGLCAKMGKISRAGQSIICLPHKVIVEVIGSDTDPESDIDVYIK